MDKEAARENLIQTICAIGYPPEFASVIADSLGTEKQMSRMTAWIRSFRPTRTEDIVDEMLAIKSEFEKYRDKKISEYCNSKYNDILNNGLSDD